MATWEPLPADFLPNSNIEQNNYRFAGVSTFPGEMTWKSGYPEALSPYSYFIWADVVSNFKEGLLPEVFNGPCVRTKSRWRVFVIDVASGAPEAVDVTSQACDWNIGNLADTSTAIYSVPFQLELVTSISPSVDFDVCDCELPGFLGTPTLQYGHTEGIEVFQGSLPLDFED